MVEFVHDQDKNGDKHPENLKKTEEILTCEEGMRLNTLMYDLYNEFGYL